MTLFSLGGNGVEIVVIFLAPLRSWRSHVVWPGGAVSRFHFGQPASVDTFQQLRHRDLQCLRDCTQTAESEIPLSTLDGPDVSAMQPACIDE